MAGPGYLVALLELAVATLINLAVLPWTRTTVSPLFFAVVIVAAGSTGSRDPSCLRSERGHDGSKDMSGTASTQSRPRVVILGGGFAGLEGARALRREPVDITLIDRRNHHLFQPLLYQVATAALNPSNIAAPIRRILRRQKNVEVVLGEAVEIDAAGRRLVLADGEVPYDYLIVAAGATHAYFGHDEWAPIAPGLKTIEDATTIRRRVLLAFEAAEREDDPARRRSWMTFVIVGGGPTGVEMAGAFAEIARHVLSRDFRHIDTRDARVLLVEGADRVLTTFPETLSAKARASLEALGVEVKTSKFVNAIDGQGVTFDHERIDSHTVIWAAGVAAAPIGRTLGVPLDRAGRVLVGPDLSIPGHPEVFVVGDLASLVQGGKLVPGVAPAAMQGGRYAARRIRDMIRGRTTKPFRYVDKGSLATIGRAKAVAVIGPIQLSGFVAWAAWLLVHIVFLIGFRNRFLVLGEWAWIYFSYERGARLITGPVHDLLGHSEPDRPHGA
jgi:NADH dehydrogenase